MPLYSLTTHKIKVDEPLEYLMQKPDSYSKKDQISSINRPIKLFGFKDAILLQS